MPNTRFVIANKLEVVGGAKVRKDDGILLIGKTAQSPLAMEPNENAVIKRRWKARRRKGDVVSALAFGTGEWIGQRLKGEQGLCCITLRLNADNRLPLDYLFIRCLPPASQRYLFSEERLQSLASFHTSLAEAASVLLQHTSCAGGTTSGGS